MGMSPSPARYSFHRRSSSSQQASPALSTASRMSFGSMVSDDDDAFAVQCVELSQDFGSVAEVMAKLKQQELHQQHQQQQGNEVEEEENQEYADEEQLSPEPSSVSSICRQTLLFPHRPWYSMGFFLCVFSRVACVWLPLPWHRRRLRR